MKIRGIDISGSNKVDYRALKNAGYDFVIARAGYGSDESGIDSSFERNVNEALDVGLHVGAYWFMYWRDYYECLENANIFLSVINKFRGMLDMPVYLDYENDTTRYYKEQTGKIPSKGDETCALITAMREVEREGWYTGYYCNLDYLRNHLHEDALIPYTRWLAFWSNNNSEYCGIWQYDGDVILAGIGGAVDVNECYVNFPEVIKKWGLNGHSKED